MRIWMYLTKEGKNFWEKANIFLSRSNFLYAVIFMVFFIEYNQLIKGRTKESFLLLEAAKNINESKLLYSSWYHIRTSTEML